MSPSFYLTVPYLLVSVLLCHYLPVYVLLPCCLLVSLDVLLFRCLLCFCPTIHMSPSFYLTVPYLLVSVLLCHYLPVYVLLPCCLLVSLDVLLFRCLLCFCPTIHMSPSFYLTVPYLLVSVLLCHYLPVYVLLPCCLLVSLDVLLFRCLLCFCPTIHMSPSFYPTVPYLLVSVLLCHYLPVYVLLPCCLLVSLDVLLFHCLLCFCPTIHMSPSFYPTVPYLLVSVLLCHYLPVYVLLPCCLLVSLDVLLFHCLLCFCPTIHMSPSFYPTVPYLLVSVLLCHYLPVYVLLPCCLLVSLDVLLFHCLLCFCPTIHMSPSFYPTVPYLLVSVLLCHYLPVYVLLPCCLLVSLDVLLFHCLLCFCPTIHMSPSFYPTVPYLLVSVLLCHHLPVYVLLPCCLLVSLDVLLFRCLLCFCPTIRMSPSFYPTVPYPLVSVLLCHYLPVYVLLPCCLLVSLDVLLFHCLLCFCPTIRMSPSFYPTVPYLLVSVLLCHYLPVYVLLPCCLLVSLDVLLFHCLLCFCPTIHMSPSFYPTVPYLLVSVLLCHYLPVYVLLPCCLLVSLDVLLFHCLLCFCPTIRMSPSFYPTVPYLLVSVLLCHYLPVYVLLTHCLLVSFLFLVFVLCLCPYCP